MSDFQFARWEHTDRPSHEHCAIFSRAAGGELSIGIHQLTPEYVRGAHEKSRHAEYDRAIDAHPDQDEMQDILRAYEAQRKIETSPIPKKRSTAYWPSLDMRTE